MVAVGLSSRDEVRGGGQRSPPRRAYTRARSTRQGMLFKNLVAHESTMVCTSCFACYTQTRLNITATMAA